MTLSISKERLFVLFTAQGNNEFLHLYIKFDFFNAFLQSVGFIDISRIKKSKTFDRIYFFVSSTVESAFRKLSKIDYQMQKSTILREVFSCK